MQVREMQMLSIHKAEPFSLPVCESEALPFPFYYLCGPTLGKYLCFRVPSIRQVLAMSRIILTPWCITQLLVLHASIFSLGYIQDFAVLDMKC